MKITRKKRRNFIFESRAESLLGLPRNPSPQDVYQAVLNYFSGISDPSKDPNADLIDRVIANVMVKNQIRKDDEHIGSKLNMLRRVLDPDKARVDSYRRSIESEMRELDPTGKKQKYEYQTPGSLRIGESKIKITKRQLRQIIKEEKQKLLKENEYFDGSFIDLDDHNRLVKDIDNIIMRMMNGRNGPTGYTREDIVYALKEILAEIG